MMTGLPVAMRALQRVSAWLPADHVPLSTDTLRALSAQRPDAPASVLEPLLQCACAWQLDAQVLAFTRYCFISKLYGGSL